MNKIKFGILGLGNIGKRHAQHILQHPAAELVGICDVPTYDTNNNPYPDIPFYTQIDQFIQESNAEVINICTPNYLHHPHTIRALELGKHVVCEKPMAISSIQCEDMIAAAEKARKKIFVVKQNRFNEPVQQVKKLITHQTLGKIFLVNINCFWNRNEWYYQESSWRGKKDQDGGCLFTQFSHFIDILYYLFGDIDKVNGFIKNYNHPYIEIEDNGSLVMQAKNGAIVNFNFSTCSYESNMEGSISILAEHGTVKIGGQYLNTIAYQKIKGYKIPDIEIVSKSNQYGKYEGSMSNHDKMIDNVINTLQGKATMMTNAEEGLQVVRIIEKMYASSEIIPGCH